NKGRWNLPLHWNLLFQVSKMDNKTVASEIIAEQQDRMRSVLYELDSMIAGDLEKCRFILGELLDMADKPINSEKEAIVYACNQSRMEKCACIAIDYLANVQRTIEDIIQREKEQKGGENADD
ncbi:MAG: hypothetical protein Q4C91_23700, partial [Eubacteriales bacterium]|nr:hypothetical protein [Eubacteriales bacterium]